MKLFKNILISIFLCGVVLLLILFDHKVTFKNDINSLYKVYMHGNFLGLINSSDDLYKLINNEQKEIMEEYNVDQVYPPNGFNIVKTNTYSNDVLSVNSIYNMIEQEDAFTIKGYVVTLKGIKSAKNEDDETNGEKEHNEGPDLDNDENSDLGDLGPGEEDSSEDVRIYVLDKQVFEEAINGFISSFIDTETLNNYLNGTQEEIVDEGELIEKLYFNRNITIKEAFIDVNNKIYTDSADLLQYLLFNEDAKINHYKVKLGDSLSSIAEDNNLNVSELLIINPKYREKDSVLKVNDDINITYINPVIDLVMDMHIIENVETMFTKKTVYDSNKAYGYSEITTPGVTGITRVTEQYQVVNGEANSEIIITDKEVLREAVAQITTKGTKGYINSGTGSYVDTGLEWGWPTNTPYKITSPYGYRWGKIHQGIDISGTGDGSPIYAAADGIVVSAGSSTILGWKAGNSIVIQHANNYYTSYAHLKFVSVSVGTPVKKGQIIGSMGKSGFATGVHLHYSISIGRPFDGKNGYKFLNPMSLYK